MSGLPAALPTLAEASAALAAGETSPTRLTEAAIARAEALQPALSAFITLAPARARAAAQRAEAELAAGHRRGPLHGIPYALKDIYDAAGLPTTAHSRLLRDNIPTEDAATTARLEAAGMILIGKLATHEFATGGPAWDTAWPPALNPWNVEHFPGGSSSGAGVAVAAGIVPMALGTDTGGSIRLPAAYCGVAGLKPTYGRVSRRGVVPLSFSLDHCGPLAATVQDCALTMQVLAGYDPRDPGAADEPVPDYAARLQNGVRGLRIGYAGAFNDDAGVDAEQRAALDEAALVFASLGAIVEPVELPPIALFNACTRAISHAESFAIHQQDLRERPTLYARVTRERLMLGAFVSSAQYVQAQRLRRRLTAAVDALWARHDLLLCAAIPGAAPRMDAVETGPWRRHQQPITAVFNVTGHPALAQPCGVSAGGLPLALQLVGRNFAEATVLQAGHAYEQATPWHRRRPALG
jgi:aspartyl-tRNA(Asn)/glutamyl-tRNA(Gln) amidotransferase subunit A